MAIFGSKTEDKKEQKQEAKAPATAALGKIHADLMGVVVQPRVSEKAGRSASLGKYIFVVNVDANKISVKKAIEGIYKVKVQNVNIVRVGGKNRNFGRIAGRTSNFKKAIVTLKAGEKIEGITETI
jgi:large subunit ribosomal protein L23